MQVEIPMPYTTKASVGVKEIIFNNCTVDDPVERPVTLASGNAEKEVNSVYVICTCNCYKYQLKEIMLNLPNYIRTPAPVCWLESS